MVRKTILQSLFFWRSLLAAFYSIHVLHIDVHKDKLKIDLGGSFQKILSVLKFCQRIVQLMLFI